jgi:hypothetical protein
MVVQSLFRVAALSRRGSMTKKTLTIRSDGVERLIGGAWIKTDW